MNAANARKQRQSAGKTTLSSRIRTNAEMARRIEAQLDELRLEQQFMDEMQAHHISGAELARRTNSKPAAISRDLSGGLSEAKLGRVRQMADAVNCDVVTLLVPRDPHQRKKAVKRIAHKLLEHN